MGPNGAKWGQRGPKEPSWAKWDQTGQNGANRAEWGQMGPNMRNPGQMVSILGFLGDPPKKRNKNVNGIFH